MKKTISVIPAIVLATILYAQNPVDHPEKASAHIYYELPSFAGTMNLTGRPVYETRLVEVFTLPSKEQKEKLTDGFLTYITANQPVKNYVGEKWSSPLNGKTTGFEEIASATGKDGCRFIQGTDFIVPLPASQVSVDPKTKKINTGKNVVFSDDPKESPVLFTFFENWEYNFKNNTFTKEIKYLGLSAYNEKEGKTEPLFSLEAPKNITASEILINEMVYDVVFTYGSKSGHVIPESGEGMDVPDYYHYIDPVRRGQILGMMIKNLMTGSAKAYDVDEKGIPDMSKQLSPDEILLRASFKYTEPLDNGEVMIEYWDMELAWIGGFRFFEKWYTGKTGLDMKKEVTGITFFRYNMEYDINTGQETGFSKVPLFFMKF